MGRYKYKSLTFHDKKMLEDLIIAHSDKDRYQPGWSDTRVRQELEIKVGREVCPSAIPTFRVLTMGLKFKTYRKKYGVLTAVKVKEVRDILVNGGAALVYRNGENKTLVTEVKGTLAGVN